MDKEELGRFRRVCMCVERAMHILLTLYPLRPGLQNRKIPNEGNKNYSYR